VDVNLLQVMQEFTYISVNNVNSSGMIEIISTDDGSSSLFNSDLNETYHSRHGAVRESTHVFIKKGLSTLSDLEQVSVLEVGMGTGLNVLLTGLYALKTKQKIDLTSLEPYPLEQSLLNKVNYEDSVEDEFSKSVFRKIHAFSIERLPGPPGKREMTRGTFVE